MCEKMCTFLHSTPGACRCDRVIVLCGDRVWCVPRRGMCGARARVSAMNFALARKKSQPIDYPSLGCTFKKTNDGISAGALIDACGLKGYSVGDAAISEKHAGFIVNLNSATAKDYISLAGTAEFAVFRRFGVSLEKEIEIAITLGDGTASAKAWGCDLTYDYVKINGDYRT